VARSDQFELVAGVDPSVEARRGVALALGPAAPSLHAELEPALSEIGVEAMIVATPAAHHEAACRAGLERGLALLVEKPFTIDLDDALALVDLAESRGTPLLVGQSYRLLRAHRAALGVVRSGRLGALRQVECRHYRDEPDPAAKGEHGTLWDLGAHHLDAIRDLVGAEPAAVLATTFDGGLSAQVLLDFRDGRRASYSVTRRSSGHERFEGGKEHYMRVIGERGTLHVLHRWLVLSESGRLPRLVRRGPRTQTEEAQLLGELAAAMGGAAPAGLTGRDNIGTMAILDACVRSATEQCWVALRGLDA
jgi:predicted dehydrogenase